MPFFGDCGVTGDGLSDMVVVLDNKPNRMRMMMMMTVTPSALTQWQQRLEFGEL